MCLLQSPLGDNMELTWKEKAMNELANALHLAVVLTVRQVSVDPTVGDEAFKAWERVVEAVDTYLYYKDMS